MARLAAVLALLALAAEARGSEGRVLPAAQVFPAGEGAPETLERPLPELIRAWQARTGRPALRDRRIVVHKARRRMDLLVEGEVLKSYVVELGLSPQGDKRAQGDRRTPEGDLYVCSKSRASQFTRFIGLSYPSPGAAAAGVAAGRVGAPVERAVRAAYRARDRCPPQRTALGGLVGIHGGGGWRRTPGGFEVVDWTWGCLALRDADVRELFDHFAEVGVEVRIEAD